MESAKLLKPSSAKVAVTPLLEHKEHFLALQKETGVPALWTIPVWIREAPAKHLLTFDCYFGNGDPLDRPTTDVPHNRGPFASWELGACDALHLDNIDAPAVWTWEYACYEWERYNGFGPRKHGRPTGYIYAGTSIYRGGKYESDGVWSPGTWDQQLGTLILAKSIAGLDPELAQGFVAG